MAVPTVGIINGTDLVIYDTTNKIAYSQSCKLSLQLDLRDTTTKDSSGWKTVLPGLQSWTMETSGLVSFTSTYNHGYLMDLVLSKTLVTLRFKTANVGDYYYTGTGYLQNVSVDSPNQANVSYSASFVGTGELALVGSIPV